MQAGGALMLGGEQDCYGGCTDASQAFYGLMDEVCAVVSVSLSQLAEAASGHCICMAAVKTPSGVALLRVFPGLPSTGSQTVMPAS